MTRPLTASDIPFGRPAELDFFPDAKMGQYVAETVFRDRPRHTDRLPSAVSTANSVSTG